MARTEYTGRATRNGDWWAISIAGVLGAHTQVRRLDKAEDAARDMLSLLLDADPDSFDVRVDADLTQPERVALEGIDHAKANYEAARAEFARRQIEAAVLLVRDEGLTVRDAAILMGVSYQRVAQLTDAMKDDETQAVPEPA